MIAVSPLLSNLITNIQGIERETESNAADFAQLLGILVDAMKEKSEIASEEREREREPTMYSVELARKTDFRKCVPRARGLLH